MNFYDAITECGKGQLVRSGGDCALVMRIHNGAVEVTALYNILQSSGGGWVPLHRLDVEIGFMQDWEVWTIPVATEEVEKQC